MQRIEGATINETDLESIIDSLPMVVIVLDRNKRIVLANSAAEEFADRVREELFGLRPGDAFCCAKAGDSPDGCGAGPRCKLCFANKTATQCIENKSSQVVNEGQLTLADGEVKELRVVASYLIDKDLVVVTICDQTELKILERDRTIKNKLEAAIETAGAICHEMNQPLQVLTGYLDLMQATQGHNGPVTQYLATSREQLEKLTVITRKLNNLRRYETEKYPGGIDILNLHVSSQD